jgi:acetyl esterase
VLRFPIVVHPDAQPEDLDFSSYEENATAPMLSTLTSRIYLTHYKSPKDDLRMSPLLANDVTCLPPTFIQIAGADPLRDDGFAYAEKLHESGYVTISTTPKAFES